MATTVTINGVSYSVPARGERGWGVNVTNLLIALANYGLFSGTNKALVSQINLGTNYGLKVLDITTSSGSNPATSGVIKLSNGQAVSWRNNANSSNIEITVTSADRLAVSGVLVPTISSTDTLTNKTIDADTNTVSNIETDNFKSGVIDTDGTLANNSDVKIATQKATKTYADTKLATASFTDAAVTGKVLTGFSTGAGTVAATDTVLQAFNKIDGNVAAKMPSSYLDTDGTLAANSDSKVASQKATKTYADTKIASSYLDTDGALAANSDSKIATQKATKTYADTKVPSSYLDTDGALAANSDSKVATQKATKTYADTKLATASFTDAAVTSKVLTGFSSGAGTVAATDTILQAFNKVDGNVGTKMPSSYLDTDGALAANSDSKVASQKATKTYADTKIASSYLDTDGALAANSDSKIATQKATKTYADTKAVKNYANKGRVMKSNSTTGDIEESAVTLDGSNNLGGIAAITASSTVGSAATGALLVPVGTTAEQPTGAVGKIRYNTTKGQFEGYDGAWNALGGGGGLTVTPITGTAIAALSTLAIGKHYVVDMSGESADKTCTLPAGSTGANIRVQVAPAHASYKLTVDGNGSEKVLYSGTDYDDIYFAAGLETWAEFAWNGTKWVCEDSTVPVKGTFSGAMTFTGLVTASSGISLGNETLSVYDEGTFTAAFTGPCSLSPTCSYVKIGKIVILYIPTATGTSVSSTYFTVAGAIPAGYRPIANLPFLCRAYDGAQQETGSVQVDTDGRITISKSFVSQNFSGSGTVGWNPICISYITA